MQPPIHGIIQTNWENLQTGDVTAPDAQVVGALRLASLFLTFIQPPLALAWLGGLLAHFLPPTIFISFNVGKVDILDQKKNIVRYTIVGGTQGLVFLFFCNSTSFFNMGASCLILWFLFYFIFFHLFLFTCPVCWAAAAAAAAAMWAAEKPAEVYGL